MSNNFQPPPIDYRVFMEGKRVRLRMLGDFDWFGLHVPKGFECDGQSWFVGEQRAVWAAVGHDYLYNHNGKVPGSDRVFTRLQADNLFFKGLIASGVSYPQACLRWTGVRVAGWKAWREHGKRIRKEAEQKGALLAGVLK